MHLSPTGQPWQALSARLRRWGENAVREWGEGRSDPLEKQRVALKRRVLNKTKKLEKERVERRDGRHEMEKSKQGTDRGQSGVKKV